MFWIYRLCNSTMVQSKFDQVLKHPCKIKLKDVALWKPLYTPPQFDWRCGRPSSWIWRMTHSPQAWAIHTSLCANRSLLYLSAASNAARKRCTNPSPSTSLIVTQSPANINSQFLIEAIDDFCQYVDQPTVLVLDRFSIECTAWD